MNYPFQNYNAAAVGGVGLKALNLHTIQTPTPPAARSLILYALLVSIALGLSAFVSPLSYLAFVTVFSFSHHFQGVFRIIANGGGFRSPSVHRKIAQVVFYLFLAALFYLFFGQRVSLIISWAIGTVHYFLDSHFLCRSKPKPISFIIAISLIGLQINQAFEFTLFNPTSICVFLLLTGIAQIFQSYVSNKTTNRVPTYAEFELGFVAILFAALVMFLPAQKIPYLFNLLAMLHILNWYYSLHFHVQKKGPTHFNRYYIELVFFIGLFAAGSFVYSQTDNRQESFFHLIYNPLFLSIWLNAHIAATFDKSRLSWFLTDWFRKSPA